MKIPTHEERVTIWRYTLAHSAFNQARVALMYLLQNAGLSEEIKQIFLYSAITSYARPFTKSNVLQSKRVVCLDHAVIPKNYKELHDEHIEWRDKAVAHSDATIFPDTLINNVVVMIKPDGFELKTAGAYSLIPSVLHGTITIIDWLIVHCEQQLNPYRHYSTGHKFGVYRMNLDGPDFLTEWPMTPPA